jgi:hypothetical protein
MNQGLVVEHVLINKTIKPFILPDITNKKPPTGLEILKYEEVSYRQTKEKYYIFL